MRAKFGYLFISVIVLGFDQWTKYWAMTWLQPVSLIEVVPGFIRLTYATNRGVAFSLFADSALNVRLIFATISAIAAFVVIYYLVHTPASKIRMNISLSLLLAGIVGNLIDRVRFGEVVDFLDFHLGEIFTWPTFNIADAAICIGAALLALELLREERAVKLRPAVSNPSTEESSVSSSD